MKKLIALALCATLALSFTACAKNAPVKQDTAKPTTTQTVEASKPADSQKPADKPAASPSKKDGGTQIANPFVDCDTIKDAEKIAGFTIALPAKMPEGYTQKGIQAISDNMIQVFYQNGDKQILIRKAKGSDDVSGDYNEYKEHKTLNAGSIKVSTRGDKGKIDVAAWVDGAYTYAITFSPEDAGFSPAVVGNLVSGVR